MLLLKLCVGSPIRVISMDVGDGGHHVSGSEDDDPGLARLVYDVKDPGAVLPECVVA